MINDRQKEILQILLVEKRVFVNDLVSRLYVSKPTVRRDLTLLEKNNYLKRIHGGAILINQYSDIAQVPFDIRALEEPAAKEIIARKAATLINNSDIVMIDSSTSAYAIIPHLKDKNDINIITNGINALSKLAEFEITTYSTGGKLLPFSFSFIGESAIATLNEYHADIAFISCKGLSLNGDATDTVIDEIAVRRTMLKNSKIKVLLCLNDRIDKQYMRNICNLADIDYLISDKPVPEELTKLVKVL